MSVYKVIQSGHIIEIYKYQKWFGDKHIEYPTSNRGGRKKEGGKEEMRAKYGETVNHRARNRIRRLISSNFNNGDLFITITFKDNITDIDYANKELKKFIQKLKRRQKDYKHVTVIEFQQRGAIHYHMLCNYFIDWKKHDNKSCGCKVVEYGNGKKYKYSCDEVKKWERYLADLWKHGIVDIKDISNIDNTGAYLIKYMTKTNIDERLQGKKRYFFTRKMNQPKEIEGDQIRDIIEKFEMNSIPVFTNEYDTDFFGKVKYMEFNPERLYKN